MARPSRPCRDVSSARRPESTIKPFYLWCLRICLTCRPILHKLLIFNLNAYNFGNYFTSFAPVAFHVTGNRPDLDRVLWPNFGQSKAATIVMMWARCTDLLPASYIVHIVWDCRVNISSAMMMMPTGPRFESDSTIVWGYSISRRLVQFIESIDHRIWYTNYAWENTQEKRWTRKNHRGRPSKSSNWNEIADLMIWIVIAVMSNI